MNKTEIIASLLLLIVVADVVYLTVATIRHRMRNMKEPWKSVKLPLDMRHHALVIIIGLIGVGLLLKAQAPVVIRMNGLEVDTAEKVIDLDSPKFRINVPRPEVIVPDQKIDVPGRQITFSPPDIDAPGREINVPGREIFFSEPKIHNPLSTIDLETVYKIIYILADSPNPIANSDSYTIDGFKSDSFPLNAACGEGDPEESEKEISEIKERCKVIKENLIKKFRDYVERYNIEDFGPGFWMAAVGGHDRKPVSGSAYETNFNLSFRRAAFVTNVLKDYVYKATKQELTEGQVLILPGGVRGGDSYSTSTPLENPKDRVVSVHFRIPPKK